MAVSLLASLTGCATRVRDGVDEETALAPDGGVGVPGSSNTPPPPPPSTTGFEMCGTELCIPLADAANTVLRNVDGARVITVENRRLLVIRLEQSSFLALSAVCTHSGCTVRYSAAQSDIECPCHGSRFTLGGDVTAGPADAPLTTYTATYDTTNDVVRIALT